MKHTPSLDAHWMPFTANRQFKQNPYLISRAEGAYLYDQHGRKLFDSLSGLWCCGLGHTRTEITQAVAEQMGRLDYSPGFQVGHELSFELANRLIEKTPIGLNKVFFTCSGSEAADTALKMARAYWRMVGQPTKTRFIGRGKGYHGVNFGGLSVGGIGSNRKLYGNLLDADHLNHTWLAENAFSRGLPTYGAHLADELEEIVALNDASNIAAVIVEPFAGSGGVIVPPQGYLKRLREICTKHNILLIFDEVITGFYRTGQCFGSQTFEVMPDMINVAKGLTNAAIPQGAVIAHEKIYNAFMEANLPLHAIEFPHGYTYSAHPVACAAGIAAMQLYDSEQIEAKVNDLIPYFENALHQLKGLPHLEDLRNCGLAGAIQLAARNGDGTIRPREVFEYCWQQGLYVRYGGNNISLAPPFIAEKSEIDQMFNILADAIRQLK
ncbi:beta-alanine--pyruvate transaminase [Thiothrix eikelboomii]|uniref:Beta-alanine--pyruvate transaminase n=1 Tax=Thiothrix eikelboomii TaxID=92487 RepID=A0A1T4W7V8_9GAMM|nr:aspartate aminotransferase family protein [Thiothrix eikelboomii]SKA73363.1 beta-alanine--pyruvate transaminase [Thiothrix eikelboomii]